MDPIERATVEGELLYLEEGQQIHNIEPRYMNDENILELSPLEYAIYDNRPDLVDMLIEQGVNLNYPEDHPPLVFAIIRYRDLISDVNSSLDFSIFEKLIANGANVNYQNVNNGYTCLHYITDGHNGYESFYLVDLLLKSGANPNVQNRLGETPLYKACDDKYSLQGPLFEVIKLLLENGADPNIRNNNGVSPIMRCIQHSYKERIVEILRRYGAELTASDIRRVSFYDINRNIFRGVLDNYFDENDENDGLFDEYIGGKKTRKAKKSNKKNKKSGKKKRTTRKQRH